LRREGFEKEAFNREVFRSGTSDICQTCSLCGVRIDSQERVHFSFGKPGSRERLYARVCSHVKDTAGCINSNENQLGPITAEDHYGFEEVSVEQFERMLAASFPNLSSNG